MAKAGRSAAMVLAFLMTAGVALADDFMMGGPVDLAQLRFQRFYFSTFLVLEVVVFIAEGTAYCLVLELPARRAYGTSFMANWASATIGVAVNVVFLAVPRWFRYPMGLVLTLAVELPIVAGMNPHYPGTRANAEAQAKSPGRRRLLGTAAVANLVSYTIGRTMLTTIWMAHAMKG